MDYGHDGGLEVIAGEPIRVDSGKYWLLEGPDLDDIRIIFENIP